MKRFSTVIILLTALFSTSFGAVFKIYPEKPEFMRYDVVNIYATITEDPEKKTLKERIVSKVSAIAGQSQDDSKNPAVNPDKLKAVAEMKVTYRGQPVKTIGNIRTLTMKYDPENDNWHGKWPVPWNPTLGEYKAEVTLLYKGKKYKDTLSFRINGRKPPPLPKGFSVMNVEPGHSIIQRVPGADGRSVKLWENYVLWAKFMGVDAVWHLVGQSQIWNDLNPGTFPWDKPTVAQMNDFGAELHKQGIKYGAWISSFIMLGNRLDLAPYSQTTGYDRQTNSLRKLIYISILDKKRHDDIAELMRRIQAEKNVDYIGLDYMRTDFGGYEFAEEFVKEMPLPGVPDDWKEMSAEDKMLWLGRKIEIEAHPDFIDMWRWWRAHKMSNIILYLRQKSGATKPIYLFSLTWEQGKHHGQDPLMFIDAGIDMNGGMFYSIDKANYPKMIDSWEKYLRQGNTNLVAGQCVDWGLLGRTYNPPGPEEHFLRQKLIVDELLPVNPSLGLFWHCISRAFIRTRGPYTPLEWAVTGSASFSYLRKKQGVFPFTTDWNVPDTVAQNEFFTVEINVKNTSEITQNFSLKFLRLSNLSTTEDIAQKFYLAPGEIKTMTFQVSVVQADPKKQNMQMLAYMIQYGSMSTQERYFDFKYITVE